MRPVARGVGVFQGVVPHVGIAVEALREPGSLYQGVGAQEAATKGLQGLGY